MVSISGRRLGQQFEDTTALTGIDLAAQPGGGHRSRSSACAQSTPCLAPQLASDATVRVCNGQPARREGGYMSAVAEIAVIGGSGLCALLEGAPFARGTAGPRAVCGRRPSAAPRSGRLRRARPADRPHDRTSADLLRRGRGARLVRRSVLPGRSRHRPGRRGPATRSTSTTAARWSWSRAPASRPARSPGGSPASAALSSSARTRHACGACCWTPSSRCRWLDGIKLPIDLP